jgi:hypothetical protein
MCNRVVILGIRRLIGKRNGQAGRWAGMPAHYARRKPGVLDIFFEYS